MNIKESVLKKIVNLIKQKVELAALFIDDCGEPNRAFPFLRSNFSVLPYKNHDLSFESEETINDEIVNINGLRREGITFVNILKLPLTKQMNIVKNGNILLCKDDIELADYKEQLIRRYCDFELDMASFNRDYDFGLRREFLGR